MERLPDFIEVTDILLNFLSKESVRKSLALGCKLGLTTNFALGCALTQCDFSSRSTTVSWPVKIKASCLHGRTKSLGIYFGFQRIPSGKSKILLQ